jgi:hypothetical protein
MFERLKPEGGDSHEVIPMVSAQYIDYNKLREGFIERSKAAIPPNLRPYRAQWEASAEFFFEMFLQYLKDQKLEIRFRHDLTES